MKQTTFSPDIDTNPLPAEAQPTYQGWALARYSDESYRSAFALVKNDSNWKLSIDAEVTVPSGVDLDAAIVLIVDAIGHYTGSLPDVTRNGRVARFKGVGYYVAVGS